MVTRIPSANLNPNEVSPQEQQENAARYMKGVFGRVPISLDETIKSVHAAGWPTSVVLHPLDFFILTSQGIPVHKDNSGPYFYLSSTRIRPALGEDVELDLTEWEPPKISLVASVKD